MFLETSAMTGENINESFHQCARIILNKIASGPANHRLGVGVFTRFVGILGSIDPYRMYSGIQCNRALAAAPADKPSNASVGIRRKPSRNCASCPM